MLDLGLNTLYEQSLLGYKSFVQLTSTMFLTNKFKAFDDSILELHPDLKGVLKPNDQYPELKHILKNKSANLPAGSVNTKLIMIDGQIIERVFKTPMGQVVSIFSKPSKVVLDQVA